MKKREVETDVSMKEELIFRRQFSLFKIDNSKFKISFLNKNVARLPHYATINDTTGCKLSK